MKRLLFFFPVRTQGNVTLYEGITKKLLNEINTFRALGLSVDTLSLEDGACCLRRDDGTAVRLADEEQYIVMMKKVCAALRTRTEKYDYVYVRYLHNSLWQSAFFASVKKVNPAAKIIAELPTFSRRWEPNASLKRKAVFVVDRLMDHLLPNNVDVFVTFDDHKRLFGKPAICIENFADVASLPIKENNVTPGELHLIGVAMMTPSHGFDRVITGLAEYYRRKRDLKVVLHVVGDGSVRPEWEALTHRLGMDDYVVFEGVKFGDEINALFNRCQLGVATLAIFRKRCAKASEIKIREYIARCLPFIYSACEPDIEGQPFCLKMPHNETPVDIGRVIDFYNALKQRDLNGEMRAFAERVCTCRAQLAKIFESPLLKD